MPRPFPFPISVGTDICSVKRIFGILNNKNYNRGARFVDKILTTRENTQSPFIQKALTACAELRNLEQTVLATSRPTPGKELSGSWGRSLKSRGAGDLADGKTTASGIASIKDGKSSAWGMGEAINSRYSAPKKSLVADGVVERQVGIAEEPLKRTESLNSLVKGMFVTDVVDDGEAVAIEEDQVKKEEGLSDELALSRLDQSRKEAKHQLWKTSLFLAGRFAAKEAAIKAYQSRRLTFHDIQVLRRPARDGKTQKPVAMVISEEGSWEDAQIVPMSISHDGEYATAVCMAYEANPGTIYETEDDIANTLSTKKGLV